MGWRKKMFLVAALPVLALPGYVSAQPAQGGDRPQLPKMFGPGVVGVGEPLPDVRVFDERGDEFRTSLLKGKYTVLVFGCLT